MIAQLGHLQKNKDLCSSDDALIEPNIFSLYLLYFPEGGLTSPNICIRKMNRRE
jgi:hypothetical protein